MGWNLHNVTYISWYWTKTYWSFQSNLPTISLSHPSNPSLTVSLSLSLSLSLSVSLSLSLPALSLLSLCPSFYHSPCFLIEYKILLMQYYSYSFTILMYCVVFFPVRRMKKEKTTNSPRNRRLAKLRNGGMYTTRNVCIWRKKWICNFLLGKKIYLWIW